MSGTALRVLAPQAFSHALDALATAYTQSGGEAVQIVYGPATGNSPGAITARLARDEAADLVLLPGRLLDEQIQAGRVVASSKTPVLRSGIGMCVRQGQALPNIGSVDGLKQVLLQARSVALSAAGSVSRQLFQRLGIEAEMGPRCVVSESESVGEVVARGGADLGFQQICELLPVPGIHFAGALPDAVQLHTDVAAGLLATSVQPAAALQWLAYLQSADAAPLFAAAGLQTFNNTHGDTLS